MKTLGKSFIALLLLAASFGTGFNYRAAAQLSVGPSGLAPQVFDIAPAASNWSTFSVGPRVAGGVISTAAQMDSAVQTNAATRVNLTLPASGTIPPVADGYAQWNSSGLYLQTRAQTNWYTLLMATLRNDTGSNIIALSFSHDLATVMGAGINATEEIPGHRAYYSITGVTGTWIHIPTFDSATATDISTKMATLNPGVWTPGSLLYVLWADANAVAAVAGSTQEGAYTIDNFAASALPVIAGPPIINLQPQSQTVDFPNQVIFSVGANGSLPLFYQWRKDGPSSRSIASERRQPCSPTNPWASP